MYRINYHFGGPYSQKGTGYPESQSHFVIWTNGYSVISHIRLTVFTRCPHYTLPCNAAPLSDVAINTVAEAGSDMKRVLLITRVDSRQGPNRLENQADYY